MSAKFNAKVGESNRLNDQPGEPAFIENALVGRRIKALRLRRNWKQVDLAVLAHIAPNTLSGLEQGRRTQWAKFKAIARALDSTTDALLSGEGVDSSTVLRTLTDDAVDIGCRYQMSPEDVQSAIRRMLRDGNADILVRLYALSPSDFDMVLYWIDKAGRDRGAQQEPLSKGKLKTNDSK